jgi:hypothetical protein
LGSFLQMTSYILLLDSNDKEKISQLHQPNLLLTYAICNLLWCVCSFIEKFLIWNETLLS